MTNDEKATMVAAMTGEENLEVVSAYLYMAGQKILSLAYPYDHDITEVPARYEHVQIDAAVYMLNKRGGEGQTAHSENGISRTYESADLPETMLRGIVPMCGVTK